MKLVFNYLAVQYGVIVDKVPGGLPGIFEPTVGTTFGPDIKEGTYFRIDRVRSNAADCEYYWALQPSALMSDLRSTGRTFYGSCTT